MRFKEEITEPSSDSDENRNNGIDTNNAGIIIFSVIHFYF
jgi:hypothetical protein